MLVEVPTTGNGALRALSQALKASVNPLGDAFWDSEGRVAPLVSGFLMGQFQHARFLKKNSSDGVLTQEPDFC